MSWLKHMGHQIKKILIPLTMGLIAGQTTYELVRSTFNPSEHIDQEIIGVDASTVALINGHFIDFYPLSISTNIKIDFVSQSGTSTGLTLILIPLITVIVFGGLTARFLGAHAEGPRTAAKSGALIAPGYALSPVYWAYLVTKNTYELSSPHPETGALTVNPELNMPVVIITMLAYPAIVGGFGGYLSWRLLNPAKLEHKDSTQSNTTELTETQELINKIALYIVGGILSAFLIILMIGVIIDL